MKSSSPTGPFTDALGKPLVSPMHDPTILRDDDAQKTAYMLYGDKEGGGYKVAKLNEDMISLAEQPKKIEIHGAAWEKAPHWMDKNYIFKHKQKYYLSWGQDYAISDSVYGPYKCVGSLGEGHYLGDKAHGSFFWWKGQFYHIWCYYYKEGLRYRDCLITYCHFDDEGRIVTDTKYLDEHFSYGVGQYDSSWPKIEAEWFYAKSATLTKQGSAKEGFRVANIKNGGYLHFAKMNFTQVIKKASLKIAKLKGRGRVEFRLDSVEGPLLAEIDLSKGLNSQAVKNILSKDKYFHFTGKADSRVDLSVPLQQRDLYLKFIGDEDFSVELDWFRFK